MIIIVVSCIIMVPHKYKIVPVKDCIYIYLSVKHKNQTLVSMYLREIYYPT